MVIKLLHRNRENKMEAKTETAANIPNGTLRKTEGEMLKTYRMMSPIPGRRLSLQEITQACILLIWSAKNRH